MTDIFIKSIMLIDMNTIPKEVFTQAKFCFLDFLSCTIAGAKSFHNKNVDLINSLKSLCNESSILGMGFKDSMQTAALINGINSHVLELDDGHRQGAVHVGGTIFSALMAVAEKEDISGDDFLYGAIIGYEATIRLACAVQPGNKLRGYHATGTCGTIGATAAIAAALHFDFEQTKSALSAAVTCAAGVLEMQEDNSDYKPLNVGRAAMDAISAAYLGKARFKAPNDALGGKRGFLKVMTDEVKAEFLTNFCKGPLAIQQIYRKTYAACRHTHSAIEAALALRNKILDPKGSLKPIKKICVETYKLAIAGHDHTEILGISSAKMSLPFSVALALCKGGAGMSDFNDINILNSQILALTKKVSVLENAELSSWVPQKRASILHISLEDGTEYTHQIDYPKGEPENPLTEDELKQKFISLTSLSGLSEDRAKNIFSLIFSKSFNVRQVITLLN